jgi:hypothetical protein
MPIQHSSFHTFPTLPGIPILFFSLHTSSYPALYFSTCALALRSASFLSFFHTCSDSNAQVYYILKGYPKNRRMFQISITWFILNLKLTHIHNILCSCGKLMKNLKKPLTWSVHCKWPLGNFETHATTIVLSNQNSAIKVCSVATSAV